MDDPHRPPKELAGVDWLWTQGARSEDRYERATGSASGNPEVSEAMRGVAKRTRIEPKDDKAEPWQQELREHAHVAQRPMNCEPTRMIFLVHWSAMRGAAETLSVKGGAGWRGTANSGN